ncbi:MAG: hypothetical protein KR126chlam6_00388 [Candidatus Anoxychlamydiales bacterium]|nr:hypothetical protein [Candidatus Anoxychlamydiales bacterium]
MSVRESSSITSLPLADVARENLPAHVLEKIPEISLQIFSDLGMYDLLSLAQVSRKTRLISEDNSLWRKFLGITLPVTENSFKKFIYDRYLPRYIGSQKCFSKREVVKLLQFFLNTMDGNTQLEFVCICPFTNLNKEASVKIGLYPKNAKTIRFMECVLLDKIDNCLEGHFASQPISRDSHLAPVQIIFSLISEYSSEHQDFYHEISSLLENKMDSIKANKRAQTYQLIGVWILSLIFAFYTVGIYYEKYGLIDETQ